MKKKIFISGGSGVIGRSLVKLLLRKKYEVYVADLKDQPHDFRDKVYYRKGNLNFLTENEIKSFKPDVFVHLAAVFERTKETYEFYENNFQNNIQLSNYLLKIFSKLKSVKKIIYASSYLTYDEKYYMKKGDVIDYPINENINLNPRNLIGAAKLYHEKELELIKRFKKNKQISILRIFRGYGCGSNDIVSRWVRKALNNKPLEVYGENGKFDYIFSDDSASALLKLIEKNFNNNKNNIFNLGSGRNYKIRDLLGILKKKFKKLKIIKLKKQILIENSLSDNKKFTDLTGWESLYNLEKGVQKILNFEKKEIIKKQPLVNNNLLISCFSEKKYPIYDYINQFNLRNNYFEKIFVSNMKKNPFHNFFKDFFLNLPECKKENHGKLISMIKSYKINYILPTSDYELNFWSKIKNQLLKENIYLIISGNKTIKLCQDKFKFFKILKKNSINVPATYIEKPNNDKKSKFIIKERYSFTNKKFLLNIRTNRISKNLKKFKNPLIQKMINGDEFSIDFFSNRSGKIIDLRIRKRIKIVDGEAKITRIVRNNKIEKTIGLISKIIKFEGLVNIQGIYKNNNFYILECNPRIGGASTISFYSGLEFLRYFVDENLGVKYFIPEEKKLTQFRFQADKLI